jgi:hypothetical protein
MTAMTDFLLLDMAVLHWEVLDTGADLEYSPSRMKSGKERSCSMILAHRHTDPSRRRMTGRMPLSLSCQNAIKQA